MLLLAAIGIVLALWLEKKLEFLVFSIDSKERPKIGKHQQSLETTKNWKKKGRQSYP